MAKKKFKLDDDFGIDDSLDMPVFDFEEAEIKDDRKPVTKLKDGFVAGLKDTAKSPATYRNLVRTALPTGYGSAMTMADQATETLKSLYNEASKDAKPVINDLKKVTKRILPSVEPVLPKSASDRIKKWAESEEQSRRSQDLSLEEQRETTTQAMLADIFKMQTVADLKKSREDDAKSSLRDSLEQGRHKDIFGQLDSIRVSMQQMAGYQAKIDSAYQRKSLELQFRHYYVAVDMLGEQKRQNAVTSSHLDAIQHNTGLPEYAKLKTSERMMEVMNNKFLGALNDGVFAKRNEFIKNFGSKMSGMVKDKVSGILDGVRSGISAADSIADLQDMQKEMGLTPDNEGMIGQMAGSAVGDSISHRVGKKIGKTINKYPGVVRTGNKLSYFTENAPQIANDFAKSDKGETGGFFDPFVRAVKDAILATSGQDNSIVGDKVETLMGPDIFSRKTNKSITEIIPGYLARIYQEIQKIRTGDDSVPLVTYDYNSNKFMDRKASAKKVFETLFTKSGRDTTKQDLDELLDEVDPEKKLSPEQRVILARKLLSDNMKNSAGSAERLSDYQTYMYGKTAKHADAFSELFQDYFKDDDSKKKQVDFARKFSRLGTYINDSRKTMQDHVNLGNRDLLEQIGILTPGSDDVNMERVYDYFTGDDFNPDVVPEKETPAQAVKRKQQTRGRKRPTKAKAKSPAEIAARTQWVQGQSKYGQSFGQYGQTNYTDPHALAQTPPPVKTEPVIEKSFTLKDLGEQLVKAMMDESVKSINEHMSETLTRIEEQLQKGIPYSGEYSGEESSSPRKGRWYDTTLKGLAKGGWNLGKKGFRGLRNISNTVRDRVTAGFKPIKEKIGEGWTSIKDSFAKIKDVYVKGELAPRMLAWKLKAGHYRDQATGAVIKSYNDIKGAVIDEEGNIVIGLSDIKEAFVKDGMAKKALKTLSSGLKSIKDFAFGVRDRVSAFVPEVYQFGAKIIGKVWDFMDRPQDVFVKGKTDPVLTAITMRGGGYTSRITGKVITNMKMIDGPVLDDQGDEVLSAADLAAGIFDKHGNPIRTGWRKVFGKIKDLGHKAIGLAKSVGKEIKDRAKGAFDWARSKVDGKFSFGGMNLQAGVTFGGSKTNHLLYQIRNLLNTRLPGIPTTFDDSELNSSNLGTGLKSLALGAKDKIKSGLNTLKDKFQGTSLGEKAKAWKDKAKEKFFGWKDRAKDKYDELKDKAPGKFSEWKDKAKEKLLGAKDKAKDKIDIGFSSMSSVLKQIRDRLSPVKKHIIGDKDGDGIRDGSYEDLMRKKGFLGGVKKDETKGPNVTTATPGMLGAMGGGIKGLWNKLRGKKEGEGDGGINIDLGGVGGGAAKTAEKTAEAAGKAAPKGFLGKAGSVAKTVGRGLWGATKLAGKVGLGLLGATGGIGLGTLGGLAGGIGSAAAGAGSAIMGGLGAAASGLGALGAGIASIISAPVVLGALAVAAVGAAGYYGYKYATRNNLSPLSKLRYVQYGFSAEDPSKVSTVFGLENQLKSAVVYNKGIAKLDAKKVDLAALLKACDVDPEDKVHVQNWAAWFAKRFKPVFLTHLTAIKKVDPKKELSDVDSLDPETQSLYLDMVKWPSGPYDDLTSPFPDLEQLPSGANEVKIAADEATETINKGKDKNKNASGKITEAGAVAGAVGAVAASAPMSDAEKANSALGGSGIGFAPVGASVSLPNSNPSGIDNTSGGVTVSGVALTSARSVNGRVDGLSCIKYKAYGLVELEVEKVRALDMLEDVVAKNVTYRGKGVAQWNGSIEGTMKAVGASFGVHGSSNSGAYDWTAWFNLRFLPVYLNYLSAIASLTGKQDPTTGVSALKDQQMLDVATAIIGTRTTSFGGGSIWALSPSPWPGYEINKDVKSTDGNMAGLKEKLKNDKLDEAFSKIEAGGSNTKETTAGAAAAKNANEQTEQSKMPQAPMSTWGSIKQSVSSTVSNAANYVADKASSVWNAGKEALGFGGGQEVAHPGKGTGGDINSLPMPTGSGSWDKLKDLITGAAKMVGVDPKLMATMAAIESGFNYTVKAATSSATGLYQFISSTWDTMIKKYGSKYGIAPGTPATDPRANALMGAEFIRENTEAIKGSVNNRPLTDTDLYIAHFMGAGGAKKFLKSDPSAIAADMMPEAAKANASIFYSGGRPLTVGEVYALINDRVRTKGKKFGLDAGGSGSLPGAGSQALVSKGGSATSGDVGIGGGDPAKANAPAKAATGSTIPVSEQMPTPVAKPASVPSTGPTAVSSNTPTATGDTAAQALGASFTSTRMRDVNIQNQSRTDDGGLMANIDKILSKGLSIDQEQLTVLKNIYEIISRNSSKGNQASAGDATKTPQAPNVAPNAPSAQPTPMPNPPVSMAKRTWQG